ncbi:MAG TPA: YceI family protein [Candidatus Kapabacteria bacterium]|nr:YceI family protein [Candidatus Kapabacteria bacterium]
MQRSITLTIGTAAMLLNLLFVSVLGAGAQPAIREAGSSVNETHNYASIWSAQSRTNETTYTMSGSDAVGINLSGTTPINIWTMSARGISGTAQMAVAEDQLKNIDALTFSLPVHNLKGSHSAMDDAAYEALKADQYKEIVFRLASATIEPDGGDHEYLVTALGELTVAGVTRTVTLNMHSELQPDGSIVFRGAQNLRMSDYNVERPSLLFGAIKARDEMTLTYTLIFTK